MAGDSWSYGKLMERYEAPLLRYASFFTHDYEAAQDIVQETFIKAYRNLASFNDKFAFSGWLYRIAHNTALDALKKHRPISLDEPLLDELTAEDSHVAAQIDRQILAKDVAHCLDQLALKYREPIILYYFQHKSYTEISDILRLPASTVGVRIKRGKAQMRKICSQMESAL